ncbi:MAG: stage II sporulation protein M [Chitinophagaceae bacterium]|nr:stage II sporulation protein M [Chitinophagaceae bacterium]
MREAEFLKKNVERWETYQNTVPDGPDETADRFVNLLDDLSYARTFYPHSSATSWINGMAANIYQRIYQNRRHGLKEIGRFWKYELPLLYRKHHKVLLFTFVLFVLFVSMAVLSSTIDADYAKSYFDHEVQPGYYDMTIDNIHKGDPFGVYKDRNPFSMFVRIAYNNIRVAFTTALMGLTFGLGTFWLLWNNGFMLGCFQYIFFSQGLGWQSILVIWIHGTIEISSIVIAGTAGFILGKSLLFPGTYTRKESFRRGARDAVNVALSLIPFFIIAAFFESYVTHLMSRTFETNSTSIGLPVPVSILILAGSLALMLWYFVFYPIKLERMGFEVKEKVLLKNGKRYD